MFTTRPPFRNRILVIWIIFCVFFSSISCAFPQALAERAGSSPQPQDTAVSPAAAGGAEESGAEALEVNVDELEVRFREEGYQPAGYPTAPLGAIAFQEDSSAAAEQEITPEGGPVELQVVDSAGLTWTLKIPSGAVDRPVTVRMVPLAQVDGSALPKKAGDVAGGVRLEPDGLFLLQPVQLSASGDALQGPTLMLTGSHTGADVDYAVQDVQASTPTARTVHFSTYFASPVPAKSIEELHKQAQQEYKQLAGEAKKMIKSPLEMPTPPSISLDCPDSKTAQKNEAVLQKFMQSAQSPELDLAGKMLAQWRIIALTAPGEVEGVPYLVTGLIQRLTRKALAMMKQYKGNEEKLIAVTQFAITTARQLALLGGDQAMIDQVISGLAEWNLSLIDKLLKDIRQEHNYKRIPTVMIVAYRAALLGRGERTEQFLNKLREALRFEAKIIYTMKDDELKVTNITEMVIPLQVEPAKGQVYLCSGEGKGTYLKAEVAEEGWAVQAYDFPVNVKLTEFDPCNGTVKVSIDRMGSDEDTATYDGVTYPWSVSKLSAESLFEAEMDKDGWLAFTVPIRNGDATMVETTIDRTRDDGIINGVLVIEIQHK